MDLWNKLGVIFFFVIVAAYILIFTGQYLRYLPGTERLVILNSRTAAFLPLYALFMLISLVRPNALPGMAIPTALVEGYTFYCYFSMIVTNLHGPFDAVQAFRNSGKDLLCCRSCFPSDHVVFYGRLVWSLFHFLVTRVIVVILAAICFYSQTKAGKALYALFNLIALVILLSCLFHLVVFYENVYAECTNIFGITKFFLLKFTVTLIVFQGLIAQFMVQSGHPAYDSNGEWTSQERTERGYCLLVLLEFLILSGLYLYTFLYQIQPPLRKLPSESGKSTRVLINYEEMSFAHYFFRVISVWDVFGSLTYVDSQPVSELTVVPTV